jgi:hypothetical protein
MIDLICFELIVIFFLFLLETHYWFCNIWALQLQIQLHLVLTFALSMTGCDDAFFSIRFNLYCNTYWNFELYD